MNEQEYIDKRVDHQIKWFDGKSSENKWWFRTCQMTQIVIATLITLSAIFSPIQYPWISFVVALLGAVVAIVSGLLGSYKFQENWLEYRITAEALTNEKYLFLTKSEPYDQEDSFNEFVNKIEGILAKENSTWAQYIRQTKSKR